VGLTIGWADAGTSTATNAGALVIHHHDLLLNLIVLVIVEVDKLAILIETLQRHHLAAADLITTATAYTFLGINRLKKFGLPGTSISG
jgi:hypothetical protein